jgi:hypothetical protein
MEFVGLTELEGRLLAMLFRRDGAHSIRPQPMVSTADPSDDPLG